MQKLLVLGGSGLVGNAILQEMKQDPEFEVYGTYARNPVAGPESNFFPMDVENVETLQYLLSRMKPQVVISCLRGSFDKQLVLHAELAKFLKETQGWLYYCSTANVFDRYEDVGRGYYEEDAVDAVSEYGQFKIECEKRIREILQERACILRLPQIWGKNSRLMNNIVNSLTQGERIQVYPQVFYNTHTDEMLAKQIHFLIRSKEKGIFHLAAEDVISHRDFYYKLLTSLGHTTEILQESLEDRGSLALLSRRTPTLFPEELRVTNASVIQKLL